MFNLDTITTIIQYMSVRTLFRFDIVSQYIHKCVRSDQVWKTLLKRDFRLTSCNPYYTYLNNCRLYIGSSFRVKDYITVYYERYLTLMRTADELIRYIVDIIDSNEGDTYRTDLINDGARSEIRVTIIDCDESYVNELHVFNCPTEITCDTISDLVAQQYHK